MGKLMSIWGLFRQGESVADPAKWKTGQITATILGGVVLAGVHVAKAFGVDLPVDTETATAIGGGVLAVVNVVLTITTSKTVGFAPAAE